MSLPCYASMPEQLFILHVLLQERKHPRTCSPILSPHRHSSLPYTFLQLYTESAPAPAAERVPKGPLDMATEESEKKIADAEEEEDKTPPRTLLSAYNFVT